MAFKKAIPNMLPTASASEKGIQNLIPAGGAATTTTNGVAGTQILAADNVAINNRTMPVTAAGVQSVAARSSYGTCSTTGNVAAKVVILPNFVLNTGASVAVKFTNSNIATNPTLNVNSTGAFSIRYNNTNLTATDGYMVSDSIHEFVYDGTYWQLLNPSIATNVVRRTGDTMTGNLSPETNSLINTIGTSDLMWSEGNFKAIYGNTESGRRVRQYVKERMNTWLNLYLNPNGSDSNDGRSASTPMKTFNALANRLYREFDLNGNSITIYCSAGTYQNEAWTLIVPYIERVGGVNIQGENRANTILNPSADGTVRNGITISGGVYIKGSSVIIKNLKITNAGQSITSNYGARVLARDILFGPHVTANMYMDIYTHDGASIHLSGDGASAFNMLEWEGGANGPYCLIRASNSSIITSNYVNFNFKAPMTVTEFISVYGSLGGYVAGPSSIFFNPIDTNTIFTNPEYVTGKKASVSHGGFLYPPSGNVNNLPGTTLPTMDDFVSTIMSGAYNRFAKQQRSVTKLSSALSANSTFTVPAYIVGQNDLRVFINGEHCFAGTDSSIYKYREIGVSGEQSTVIQLNVPLQIGDIIGITVR